ncbi:MAG: SDR family oxidoreductase [archaeon YNP-LCB-003-016]|uniref:UDP-glucuronic acid decarboxylase family protein n=1 Tax=Candidatus Culexarchaeum yellowstonense TaxID=2928963 RepID=UPI0026EDB694|nr:UDP-glucuronic acid decarboxylase family protein [Candidatus Culexarchaeum yellowstonense]MCR6691928.1 SDR family oxidoreductase [Candidatus Culexarchaeum yellowstonense]
MSVELIVSQFSGDLFRGRRILVTGGAGFLGSWLCEALTILGANVSCLDNLSTSRVENIMHLKKYGNFKFIKADISEYHPEGFDFIVHGASLPSPDDYMRRPVDTMLPNSLGLLNCLEAARKGSIVLYTSTSEVYGDAEIIPTPEDYWGKVNPIGLRSCYDESKRFGEALCMAYYRQYGVDVRVARIFNSYGPRLDPESRYARVIPRFIMQALRNEPLTIHGDGMQTRSFTYVTDTVNALIKMLINDGVRGEVVNIGSQNEVKIIDLAKMIIRLTGSSSKIVFTEARPDDPRRRCPDISKARKLLNWEPKISLEDGLKYTIEWFRRQLNG